jgi:hypothetical protein
MRTSRLGDRCPTTGRHFAKAGESSIDASRASLRTRDRFGLLMSALLLALALGAGGAVRVQLGPLEVDLWQSQVPVTPVRIPRRGSDISTSGRVPSFEEGRPNVASPPDLHDPGIVLLSLAI